MNGNNPTILRVYCRKEDFHKICRLCLSETEEVSLINLFVVKYEDIFIKDILEQLFGDKIISANELPQNLCEKCITEIIRCYNFKKTYDFSKLILQTVILNNSKQSSDESCIDEIKVVSNNIEEHPDEPCHDEIKLEPDEIYEDINTTITNDPLEINPADQCEISLIQDRIDESIEAVIARNSTQDHNQSDKDNSTEIEEVIIKEDVFDNNTPTDRVLEAKIYRCACTEIFQLESELIQHKKEKKHKSSRKNYICKLCNRFFDRNSYVIHLRAHNKEKLFVCEICSERFSVPHTLRRHVAVTHNGEKPHVCEVCDKRFGTLYNLEVHKRRHTGEKPYLCDTCGKRFRQRANFLEHSHRDTENYGLDKDRPSRKKVTCTQCLKPFSSASALYLHKFIHGEKQFSCHICQKSFHVKSRLKSHIVTHASVKPFPCLVCPRKFADASKLKRHKLWHMGIKPYRCKHCSNSFTQSAHLYRHIRSRHTDERPYVCKFCNKAFADSGNFKVHVRIHTGERPYKCDLCSRAFYDSSSMKKHRKIHLGSNVEKEKETS